MPKQLHETIRPAIWNSLVNSIRLEAVRAHVNDAAKGNVKTEENSEKSNNTEKFLQFSARYRTRLEAIREHLNEAEKEIVKTEEDFEKSYHTEKVLWLSTRCRTSLLPARAHVNDAEKDFVKAEEEFVESNDTEEVHWFETRYRTRFEAIRAHVNEAEIEIVETEEEFKNSNNTEKVLQFSTRYRIRLEAIRAHVNEAANKIVKTEEDVKFEKSNNTEKVLWFSTRYSLPGEENENLVKIEKIVDDEPFKQFCACLGKQEGNSFLKLKKEFKVTEEDSYTKNLASNYIFHARNNGDRIQIEVKKNPLQTDKILPLGPEQSIIPKEYLNHTNCKDSRIDTSIYTFHLKETKNEVSNVNGHDHPSTSQNSDLEEIQVLLTNEKNETTESLDHPSTDQDSDSEEIQVLETNENNETTKSLDHPSSSKDSDLVENQVLVTNVTTEILNAYEHKVQSTNQDSDWSVNLDEIPETHEYFSMTFYNDKLYVVGSTLTHAFDIKTWSWSRLASFYAAVKENRTRYEVCACKDAIYVIGGKNDDKGEFPQSLYRLDLLVNEWKGVDRNSNDIMLEGRTNHGVFAYLGEIYIIGGKKGDEGVKKCEKVTIISGKAGQITHELNKFDEILEACLEPTFVVSFDRVYVIGSNAFHQPSKIYFLPLFEKKKRGEIKMTSLTLVFNNKENEIASKIYHRYTWVVSSIEIDPGGKEPTIVIGGGMSLNEKTGYDTVEACTGADNWKYRPSLPSKICSFGMVSHKGKIIIAGGYNGESPQDQIYMFDPARWSWRKLALEIPRKLMGLSMESYSDKVYVIGGLCHKSFINYDTLSTIYEFDIENYEKSSFWSKNWHDYKQEFKRSCLLENRFPKALHCSVIPELCSKIYITGGISGIGESGKLIACKDTYSYECNSERHRLKKERSIPLSVACIEGSSAFLKNMWIVVGRDNGCTLHVQVLNFLDVAAMKWSKYEINNGIKVEKYFGIVAKDDNLYLIDNTERGKKIEKEIDGNGVIDQLVIHRIFTRQPRKWFSVAKFVPKKLIEINNK